MRTRARRGSPPWTRRTHRALIPDTLVPLSFVCACALRAGRAASPLPWPRTSWRPHLVDHSPARSFSGYHGGVGETGTTERGGEEGQRRGEVESEGGRRKKGRGVGGIYWRLWPPALCLCFSLSIPVGFLTDSLDACTSCDVKDTQETVKRGRGGGRRGKRTVVRLNV